MKIVKDLGMFPYGNKGRKQRKVIVECESCETQYEMTTNFLRTKKSSNCQICNNKINPSSKTHGKTKTSLFETWNSMINRCYGKRTEANKYWNDVKVCDEWRDFETFESWALASGYKKGLHIDKDILCDRMNLYPKIYSPSTCLWITAEENTAQRNLFSPKKLVRKNCKECNKIMYRSSSHKFCTEECATRNKYDTKNKKRRVVR